MKTVKNQETNKSIAFTESKSLRNDAIEKLENYDFLDKLKVIPYLTEDFVVTAQQASNFYDCTYEAVRTLIKRNQEEFISDGMVVLTGADLKEFKRKINDTSDVGSSDLLRINSLTLLPKKSLLRIGMILTGSYMATKIRNYLLNIEENTEVDRKSWAIQREVGIVERKRMTSAISRYIPDSKNKKFAYPNYTNMIYKIIFGCDAKALRVERNVKTNDALRDSFTESELKKVEEVETIVTGLISMDFTYKQIEQMLNERYIKKIS